VERGAREVFPPYLTAALLLVSLVVATRGLHLDGFMDVCDGLLGGYTPQRRLEIMRDSHVGSFAVAGVASLLLVKYGALLSLLTLTAPGGSPIPWALLLFPMLSRWAMVIVVGAFPYVRGQGLGSPFHQESGRLATALAMVVAVAAAVLLGGIGGAGMLIGVCLLAWLLGWGMAALLGGLTGDTYGATNEMTEVAALVAAVGLARYGLLEPLPLLLG
jgi:adenosylcobinamide-GDP ribazoletransferase